MARAITAEQLLPQRSRDDLLLKAGSTSRAGSPLLFGLAPRGVFHAPDIAIRTVGSYPTFSPLPKTRPHSGQRQTKHAIRKTSRRSFLRDVTVLLGRRYILCGTFRERISSHRPRPCSPIRSPGVTRRVALYPEPAVRQSKALPESSRKPRGSFVTGPCGPTTTVSGLSSRPLRSCQPSSAAAVAVPAITRLTRYYYYTVDLSFHSGSLVIGVGKTACIGPSRVSGAGRATSRTRLL
jgi:hypothetical protein